MAYASFKLLKCTSTNAATETDSDKAPNFLSTDSATDSPASAPLRVPATGTSYSFEAWFRLECTAAPDNYAENFKVFGPATQPDDPRNKLVIKMGISTPGVTPVATASSVATTAQHSNYNSAGTALLFDDVNETVTAIGNKTRFFVAQMNVSLGAEGGDILPALFNFTWDET